MKIFCYILVLIFPLFLNAEEGVVLLHGLCRSSSSMERMERSLREEGYYVLNMDYPSRSAGIQELSELVIGSALQDQTLAACSRIHFVTHSLGGIMVRSYFSRHLVPELGRVVMLGPPNQGSEVVDKIGSWWLFKKLNGPSGNELGTGEDSTPNQLCPVNFELGVIAGDRSINWINSVMIEGSDDGKVSIEHTKVEGMKEHLVLHATHPYIMKKKVVINYTIQFLRTGSFNRS